MDWRVASRMAVLSSPKPSGMYLFSTQAADSEHRLREDCYFREVDSGVQGREPTRDSQSNVPSVASFGAFSIWEGRKLATDPVRIGNLRRNDSVAAEQGEVLIA